MPVLCRGHGILRAEWSCHQSVRCTSGAGLYQSHHNLCRLRGNIWAWPKLCAAAELCQQHHLIDISPSAPPMAARIQRACHSGHPAAEVNRLSVRQYSHRQHVCLSHVQSVPSYMGVHCCRSSSGCSLSVTPQGGSTSDSIARVTPLTFVVQESTPIRSAAYQLLHDCEGSSCSFDV